MSTPNPREKAVFYAALDVADLVQRREFLDDACAGDAELRAAVDELLKAQGDAEQFFAEGASSLTPLIGELRSAAVPVEGTAFEEAPGTMLGRYRVIEKIGEGGFGVVYLAEQEEPVRRRVALKVIKLGMDTRSVITRFEAERQALALMEHPNIARVFDAGATETGRPYFVMELVQGVKITEYCDQNQMGMERRLELFIQVCQAIQHAHQKGIIHRDIKPSNILVTLQEGVPVPKVIDFGIAKATEEPLTDKTLLTACAQWIGTPAYMSPEQMDLSSLDLDTRSDIYSLGVLLYELLTGQPPFDTKELLKSGLDEMRRILRECEPRTPSTKLHTLSGEELEKTAACRQIDPARLLSQVRGDLDWITLKALEKDRARRYETAAALARDLEHYLHHEPVSAVPPTWRYTLGKFARRHRGALVAASLIVAALIAGTVVSLWEASVATRNRHEAEHRYDQARDAVDKYLARVTDDPKLQQDNFENLRRDLLETAVPFFEEMGRYKGDDAKLRADQAWAIAKLGNLYRDTGQFEKAEAALRQALDLRLRLAAQFPEDPRNPVDLMMWHSDLALIFAAQEKWELTLEQYDETIKIEGLLVARSPEDDRHLRKALACSLANRGTALGNLHRYESAMADLEKARVIQEKLVAQFPEDIRIRRDLGSNLTARAGVFQNMGRPEESIPLYLKGLEIYDQLAHEKVNDHNFLQNRAISWMLFGETLQAANRWGEAESAFRTSVDQFRAMVDKFPEARDHRQGMIHSQQWLMSAMRQEKKWPEFDALLIELRREVDRLTANAPSDAWTSQMSAEVFYEQGIRALERQEAGDAQKFFQRAFTLDPKTNYFVNLANIELSRGDYDSVMQQMQTLPRLPSGGWQDEVQQAEILVKILPLIEADPKLEAAARDKLLESSSARIVELLKKAIAGGYTGISDFDRLSRTAALQRRTDYQALLRPNGTPSPLPEKPPPAKVVPPPAHPRKFTFAYKYDDPGPRHWALNGTSWTETQPSGKQNTFVVIGPREVNGVRGTVIERLALPKITLFVPDIGAEIPMRLRMKKDSGWISLGTITDVE